MKVPRLALFDCDGTLVDSQHVIVACMTEAFSGEGLVAPPLAEVRRIIGLPLEQCMLRLAPDHSARHVRLVEAYKEAFFALRRRPDHHEPLFEGALAALEAVAGAGWLLGVATGKSKRGLVAVLEHHGLANRFMTLQCGDMGPGKPDPAMLKRAMAETGTAPEDTVMIGDTTYDMLMASRAGVHAIGVEWGYHDPAELREAGAHATVTRFADLPAAVARCIGTSPCAA
ncbi:MAG TPA: HAD-IA family hydrolase [Alphaproteobacteria bacterium]